MSSQESAPDGEVDQDGIKIPSYRSMVLVVVPEREFAEESLRYARACLQGVQVGTRSVSTNTETPVSGRLQDEFLVDGALSDARMEEYAGVLFVGGEGALELAENPDAQRVAREATQAGKPIGVWGHGLAILARAGVLQGRRVTGAPELEPAIRSAGGRYTGLEVEVCGSLVTARDDAAGLRFGLALAGILA